jgi:hypothetical protein
VEQHKLHYEKGVNSWSNTNSTTESELVEQHKLHYKQGMNSCGLEALNNTNFTTNRE